MSFGEPWLQDLRERLCAEAPGWAARHGVSLDPRGRACCPFHAEDTPSFQLSTKTGRFHCFGCGWDGDALALAQQKSALGFPDAVRDAVAFLGVDVPGEEGRRGGAPDESVARCRRALEVAQTLFSSRLGRHTEAVAYLRGRGFPREGWEIFGFGYAPGGGALREALLAQGLTEEDGMRAGLLVAEGEHRGKDFFFRRVTLPVRDPMGRVLSFVGRRIDGEKEKKYLNGPETSLFHKGEVLYGLDLAAAPARRAGFVHVVEGHFDRVACHVAGAPETVACQGTELTGAHVQALSRLGAHVYLCFDADEAGRKAALKAAHACLLAGVPSSVVTWPTEEGKDLDEVFRRPDPDGCG